MPNLSFEWDAHFAALHSHLSNCPFGNKIYQSPMVLVAGMERNRWPKWSGIGGRNQAEYPRNSEKRYGILII